jgi:predicted glutamine amidotransferase
VADRPTSVVDVLGEDGLDTFTSLTAVHGDGWGMAWHDPSDHVARHSSSPESAALDPTYVELARQPLGLAGLVHLRWATGGLAVTPENTHPFTDGGYAFAHNGHVAPIERLESMLSLESRGALVGDTDSERYFRLVMQSIAATGDEERGVMEALRTLLDAFPDSSLNALLLTPTRLFAVHINSRATSPSRALNEMFESEEDIPHRHATDYFAMDYRVTPDAVHVISSGIDEPGWSRVPGDTAAMIDLATREMKRLDP